MPQSLDQITNHQINLIVDSPWQSPPMSITVVIKALCSFPPLETKLSNFQRISDFSIRAFSMNSMTQAFAASRPLFLPHPTHPQLQCIRRRSSPPSKITPRATRATLTPEPSSTSAIDASSLTPTSSGFSADDLSPADRSRIHAVRAQMEFWFSASNLRRDWYLRRQMDDEGWLDPSTFLRFNRIKSLHASLRDIILACSISDELEVTAPDNSFGDVEGQTRIRRSPSLPDFREWDEDELQRSFIFKGIPSDSTVESLQYLLQPLGSPSYIRVYRSNGPTAQVAALICFEDVAAADAAFHAFTSDDRPEVKGITMKRRNISAAGREEVVAGGLPVTPKPNLLVFEVSGLPLDLEWKTLYDSLGKICLEKTGIPVRYLMFDQGATNCHVTVADSSSTRAMGQSFEKEGGILIGDTKCEVRLLQDPEEIQNYWQMASEHQAKRKARRTGNRGSDPDSEGSPTGFPQGVIVHMEGFNKGTSWREIKTELQEMGRLVYLSFDRRSQSCYARFGSPVEAQAIAQAISGESSREICDANLKAYVIYGEEEEEYWERAQKIREDKMRQQEHREEIIPAEDETSE